MQNRMRMSFRQTQSETFWGARPECSAYLEEMIAWNRLAEALPEFFPSEWTDLARQRSRDFRTEQGPIAECMLTCLRTLLRCCRTAAAVSVRGAFDLYNAWVMVRAEVELQWLFARTDPQESVQYLPDWRMS
jgi:hypothetical protein